MVGVEGWAEIRRLHFVKGLSIREVARRTGHGRDAVRWALRADEPPRYRRPLPESKLEPGEGDRALTPRRLSGRGGGHPSAPLAQRQRLCRLPPRHDPGPGRPRRPLLGGGVITNAATSAPQVKALVYANGHAPDAGETVVGLTGQRPGSALGGDPAKTFAPVPYPNAPQGDVDLYVRRSLFPPAFRNDLPAARAAVLAALERPVAACALQTPSGTPAWRNIPSWYLVGTLDRVLPPAQQLLMAHRAGSHVARVRARTCRMLSRPAAAAIIRAAAAS